MAENAAPDVPHGVTIMTSRRSQRETKTIQTWPGGQSFEYRGDPDGPANQKSLRAGHYQAMVRCPSDCRVVWLEDGELFTQGSAAPVSSVYVNPSDDPRAGKHCLGDPVNYPERFHICSYCKGAGHVKNPKTNPWRKGTADEWRKIRISLRAEIYWSQNGLGCDSSLVDDLIKAASSGEVSGDLAEGFGYDEIRNIYADPSDWDAEQCREYAEDNGIDLPDVPTITADPEDGDVSHGADCAQRVIGAAECTCGKADGTLEIPDPDALEDDSPRGWLNEAREACQEHAQDNPAEVYEWWRVSSWLCDQLHAIGEVTIDNGYGHWWGRTCTGQGLLMDGTIQKVAAQFERMGDE